MLCNVFSLSSYTRRDHGSTSSCGAQLRGDAIRGGQIRRSLRAGRRRVPVWGSERVGMAGGVSEVSQI